MVPAYNYFLSYILFYFFIFTGAASVELGDYSKVCVWCLYICRLCIYVLIDFCGFDLRKDLNIWEEFWKVHLLITQFDCPEVTRASLYDRQKITVQLLTNPYWNPTILIYPQRLEGWGGGGIECVCSSVDVWGLCQRWGGGGIGCVCSSVHVWGLCQHWGGGGGNGCVCSRRQDRQFLEIYSKTRERPPQCRTPLGSSWNALLPGNSPETSRTGISLQIRARGGGGGGCSTW